MPTQPNILGVSGSMRERSHSARCWGWCWKPAGARGRDPAAGPADARAAGLPPRPPVPRGVRPRGRRGRPVGDAIVIATPDYHGSMSGAVKNFLDYHWKEFTGKLFGYVVASHEKGLTVMDQLRTAVRQCYGWSLPYGVATHGAEDFDPATGADHQRQARQPPPHARPRRRRLRPAAAGTVRTGRRGEGRRHVRGVRGLIETFSGGGVCAWFCRSGRQHPPEDLALVREWQRPQRANVRLERAPGSCRRASGGPTRAAAARSGPPPAGPGDPRRRCPPRGRARTSPAPGPRSPPAAARRAG